MVYPSKKKKKFTCKGCGDWFNDRFSSYAESHLSAKKSDGTFANPGCRKLYYPCCHCSYIGENFKSLKVHYGKNGQCLSTKRAIEDKDKVVLPERLNETSLDPSASSNSMSIKNRQGMLISSETISYVSNSSTARVVDVVFNENIRQNNVISPKNPQIPCASLLSSPQRAEQKKENERFLDNSLGCDDDHHDDSFLYDWDSDNNVQFAQTLSDEEESVHGLDGRTAEVPNHTNDQVGINSAAFNQTEDPSIRELVRHRLGQKEYFLLTKPEEMYADLFHLLQVANAPRNLFDKIVEWGFSHSSTLSRTGNKKSRMTAMKHVMQKLYNDDKMYLPTKSQIQLSSGRKISITKFSLRAAMVEMLSDADLMTRENLLWDIDEPWKLPEPEGHHMYGEPNTGTWHSRAVNFVQKKFGGSNRKVLLLPMAFFIDGLKIDKYSKLKCEAVIGNWLIFKRKCRNKVQSWFPLGFVEDQGYFTPGYTNKEKTEGKKIQDYHDMLKEIFGELRVLQETGICCDLVLDDVEHNNVLLYPDIQYIIGDCEGNDKLCGRFASHSTDTPWLCRDCNVPSQQGHDHMFQCTFTTKADFVDKSREELKRMSHHLIKNTFHEITNGDCPRNIHGNSPVEFLHQLLLGNCDDVGKCLNFTDAAMKVLDKAICAIYPWANSQSYRMMPNLHPFRTGMTSVSALKATERYAKVFAIYLCLLNPSCIDGLMQCQQRGQRSGVKNSLNYLRGYFAAIDETVIFHDWLKRDEFSQTVINSGQHEGGDEQEPKALARIRDFYKTFKDNILVEGNQFDKPKSHQLLHIPDIIKRHGACSNYDGSRGEFLGKVLIKDNAKRTVQKQETLSYDVALRYAEAKVITDCKKLQMMNRKPPARTQHITGKTNKSFELSITADDATIVIGDVERINISMQWLSTPPVSSFDRDFLLGVIRRLYFHSPSAGGCVAVDSKIPGLTDYTCEHIQTTGEDGEIIHPVFRANPYFRSHGPWYDWAMFRWEGYDEPIPAQIKIILDLRNVDIITDDVEEDEDGGNVQRNQVSVDPILTNDVFFVVFAGDGTYPEDFKDNYFDSSICKRFRLEKHWTLAPASAMCSEAFVIPDIDINNPDSQPTTACLIKSRSEWPDTFLRQ